eukprot:TRINITY_DN58989_c0_g1_i1.p1 TRINITY_DN58989_c0_g1~~TRINITY_DN58989_c0_g1_i1.p1  ORF type:complete len:492 (+),score=74.76 TRINITY_DN58989_c0_g1_i1:57-1532(+)
MKRSLPVSDAPSLEEIKSCIERRLFVGRLPASCTEDELRDAYSSYGQIVECRVLGSKGVGFVGFTTWAAAHRALIGTDAQPCLPSCNGAPISVFFAERSGNRHGSRNDTQFAKGLTNSRIFVGGLPDAFADDDLVKLFSRFGSVKAANLLPAKVHVPGRRCGFVNFSIWGEAMDAIESMNGKPVEGYSETDSISVVLAEPREANGAKRQRNESFDQGFSSYKSHGAVSSNLESLKDAYLSAVDGSATEDQCNELHRKIMAARRTKLPTRILSRLNLQQSSPESEAGGPDDARLFLGGLPHECTDDELLLLIDQIPFDLPLSQSMITECRVLAGKGCGYLKFSSWEAATIALDALNDREVAGWAQPLRAKWAVPKSGSQHAEICTHAEVRTHRAIANHQAHDESVVAAQGLDPKRLFVGQLARELRDKNALARVFEPFGAVENIRWLEDKGVAYIQYSSFEAAQAALSQLSGQNICGVSRREGLNLKFANLR